MAEIARVTGVSRQTLYELRGRYGDTADLRLAVLQAILTQWPAALDDLAEHLKRPASEIKPLVDELMDQELVELDLDVRIENRDYPYAMTAAGLRALESWSLAEDAAVEASEGSA